MTTLVPSTEAEWLKSDALYAEAARPDGVDWGTTATTLSVVSPLALAEDAADEAARQAAVLAGPLVIDEHLVAGARADLLGRLVPIVADRLGYEQPAAALVLSVAEADDGTTTLTVLRRL